MPRRPANIAPISCEPAIPAYEVVKQALRRKGHNQQWLAQKTGYSISTINAYLNGRMPLASNQFVTVMILKHTGLTLNDIAGTGPRHNNK